MAQYLVQGETMTAIADAIRGKSGKTDTLTPSQMATEIGELGAGSASVDTCTVILHSATGYPLMRYAVTRYIDGQLVFYNIDNATDSSGELTIENVLCGSIVYVYMSSSNYVKNIVHIPDNCEVIGYYNAADTCYRFFRAPLTNGDVATIEHEGSGSQL